MDEQKFNEYLNSISMFIGNMTQMANSIELMLNVIFEKIGISHPRMLGPKINEFEECKSTLSENYIGDFDILVDKLKIFNKNWNITKHGMVVGGTKNFTIHKDDAFYTFEQSKVDEINNEFTQIMKALIEISNGL